MTGVGSLHALTLGDVLREQRRSYADRTAVVCGEHRLTYAALDDRVNRVANALADLGVADGDRVVWLGQNCHRLLETLVATARLGAICCPINWRNSASEMAFVIDDATPTVVIWQDEEIGERVALARGQVAHDAHWLQHDNGEYESLVAAAADHDDDRLVDPAASVLMLYTAAFEGTPNGALLSHSALLWQSLVWGITHDFTDTTIYLASEPLFHVAGLMNLVGTVQRGGTNVVARRVDADTLCQLVEVEHCTTAYLVDKTINEIVDINKDGKYDLTSLYSPPRNREWDAMVTPGTSLWDREMGGYGQTETMGMLTYHCLGSRPLPGTQARVIDRDGVDVGAGDAGELVARGPTMMNGYYQRADLNAPRQRDDWHHTNDLARRDAHGRIIWLGSMDRLIKSGSENVYPAEVEACLHEHPAVAACEVVGLADPQWGERVHARVVLRDARTATEQELLDHCSARLASYKKPRSIELLARLPDSAR